MKKIICLILILTVCGSSGCSIDRVQDVVNVAEPREVAGGIFWIEYPFSDSHHYESFGCHFSETDRMDHNELQEQIAGIPIEYPIDTDEKTREYAWAFYDIAVSMQLLDPNYLPYNVQHYSDGIAYIMFLEPSVYGAYYDGPTPCLYFSEEDGHIIHYEVVRGD